VNPVTVTKNRGKKEFPGNIKGQGDEGHPIGLVLETADDDKYISDRPRSTAHYIQALV
jgi:hypothetical protein